jgi:hypothetical protein
MFTGSPVKKQKQNIPRTTLPPLRPLTGLELLCPKYSLGSFSILSLTPIALFAIFLYYFNALAWCHDSIVCVVISVKIDEFISFPAFSQKIYLPKHVSP